MCMHFQLRHFLAHFVFSANIYYYSRITDKGSRIAFVSYETLLVEFNIFYSCFRNEFQNNFNSRVVVYLRLSPERDRKYSGLCNDDLYEGLLNLCLICRYEAEALVNGIPYGKTGYRGSARLFSIDVSHHHFIWTLEA